MREPEGSPGAKRYGQVDDEFLVFHTKKLKSHILMLCICGCLNYQCILTTFAEKNVSGSERVPAATLSNMVIDNAHEKWSVLLNLLIGLETS